MDTVAKGDQLEDRFYDYLIAQRTQDNLLFGVHPPSLCQIHKKKKFFCNERQAHITFDVVVEIYAKGATEPHLTIICECKNYGSNIPENEVTDFSDKLTRISRHGAKGIMVVSAPLQSGAESLVRSRKIGLIKFDGFGFETVIHRKQNTWTETKFIENQLFQPTQQVKPLKFSAYYDGHYFSSAYELFGWLDNSLPKRKNIPKIPYISDDSMAKHAKEILTKIHYQVGAVNLDEVCSLLSVELKLDSEKIYDANGKEILGFAKFDTREIQIYSHDNKNRERFTIGHEIGHFHLNHDEYLLSETIIENDLFSHNQDNDDFNYRVLEFQANNFASHLLLPNEIFLAQIYILREKLDIKNRGYGYLYVDDQPCNYRAHNTLLSSLSSYFEVSKQAIEIKLLKMNLLNDQRTQYKNIDGFNTSQ